MLNLSHPPAHVSGSGSRSGREWLPPPQESGEAMEGKPLGPEVPSVWGPRAVHSTIPVSVTHDQRRHSLHLSMVDTRAHTCIHLYTPVNRRNHIHFMLK